LLEVEVLEAPQVRYTQDNQTPVAEMAVQLDGLRPDDPPGQIKVVGWGSLAQDLQNRVQVGQRLVLEGRLRMNTVTRQDGVKEKRAEFTLSRLHPLGAATGSPASTAPGSRTRAHRRCSGPNPGSSPGRGSRAPHLERLAAGARPAGRRRRDPVLNQGASRSPACSSS
jgi:single-strand DNA-binding protein